MLWVVVMVLVAAAAVVAGLFRVEQGEGIASMTKSGGNE